MTLRFVKGDFETVSKCELKKAGTWRYSEDPTTDVLCFVWRDPDVHYWRPGMDSSRLLALAEDDDVTFSAHNAGFEKAIWRNIMVKRYGFPDIPDHRWHDTMAVCAMKAIPLELDMACRVLGLRVQKDTEGSNFVVGLSKQYQKTGDYDRSEAARARTLEYCMTDVEAELELHSRIGWFQPGERRVWLLDQRINERGVRLDMNFVRSCQLVVDRAIPPLLREFQGITGLKSVGQRDRLIEWCGWNGLDVPNMKKDTIKQLLGETEADDEDFLSDDTVPEGPPPVPSDVRRALEIKQLIGSAAIKKLAAMEACVGADGRARGLLQYHGAGTGRWAGRLLQPQNFPRGTIKELKPDTLVEAVMTGEPDTVELVTGKPPVESVIHGLRHAIIADHDRVLCAGDFSSIEARVVLALAGQHDKTDLLAKGLDPSCDLAATIYGRPIDKDRDPEERQFGKEGVLGCGFQMGWRKFAFRLRQKGIKITGEEAEKVVTTYRDEWAPSVPKVWYGLERAAIRALKDGTPQEAFGVVYHKEDGFLTARLPSGRKLYYFNPQLIRKAMPWDDTDIRDAWTYQVKKMGIWRTVDAYGGLLTENVVQALARDLMVHAMITCEREGFPVVLTVHDEVVTEPEAWMADPLALKQMMCDHPAWARALRIPVSAGTWAGDRYRK